MKSIISRLFAVLFLLCIGAKPAQQVGAAELCRIEVVDAESGWPVSLVELKTNHHYRFLTDNAGVVAFDLPELFGKETWFWVKADGYEVSADGFGYRGVRLTPEPGARLEVRLTRTILAKRLGRLTGGGLFAESQKLGEHSDWKESGILGTDSVQTAVHKGRLFWAWGDTIVPRYPLGIFHMSGATTAVRPLESFEPPVRLDLDYFTGPEGAPRSIADMGGKGPTWVNGCISLPDAEGEARLVGHYAKIEPPMDVYLTALCVWNDETANFEQVKVLWEKEEEEGGSPPEFAPVGRPVRWTDEEGMDWVLFGDPFPNLKVPATYEAWLDPSNWEKIDAPESLDSAGEGRKIEPHRGSIAWNQFRRKWVSIFGEKYGDPSVLGEIWYTEAETPFSPWASAVKVLSHDEHTFYNPRMHPELVPENSPVLLFEGTYTKTFSKAQEETPRYDYNQILYRLDLDDPAFLAALEQE